MARMADKIMERVSAHDSGKWVCTPRDFLDLGSREAVDQALYRLVKAGQLRRVGHGLYDMPRISEVLKRPAPVDLDAAIAAIARRDGVRIMPDGLVSANQLGPHQRGTRKGQLCNRRALENAQDRRTNGSVPTCESERHAVGGETRGPGGSSAAVAGPRRRRRRTRRFNLEAPSA